MSRTKHIAINAVMYSQSLGGAATYIRNLVRAAIATPDPTLEIRVYASPLLRAQFGEQPRLYPTPLSATRPVNRILSEMMYWPFVLKKHNIDLFHSPISYIPPGVNIPAIVTLHDLRVYHYPETYTPSRRKFLQKILPRSARKAVNIITISNHTKQDIIRTLDIPSEKITVIHEGIDLAKFQKRYPQDRIAALKQKYRLSGQYILAVGHLEPRKNYIRLLEAFSILKENYHLPHSLVIVGQENWYYQDIYKRVRELNLEQQVHFTGYVADPDLAFLYQNAEVYIAPSLFEGFGLTPLESMAAGVPVAASNCTSHPEVCGDAALYFDPFDVEDMAETIVQLLDKEVQNHLNLQAKSQLAQFNWSRCYQQTFELYKTCLEQM